MNYQYTIVALLCFSSMYTMETEIVKFGKHDVEKKTPFELGLYNNDYEDTFEPTEWQFKKQPSLPKKPYIPDEKEGETSCCSFLMLFIDYYNHQHAYPHPISFPK